MGKLMYFKSKKQISDYFSGNEVECLICHKNYKSIGGQHLKLKHGMSVDQYKKKFGLPLCHALESESTRIKKRSNLMRRLAGGDTLMMTMTKEKMDTAHHSQKKKGRKVVAALKGHYPALHLKNALQKKNESDARIAEIDWDKFLDSVKKTGMASWGLRNLEAMPSSYSVRRKMKSDPLFAEKYTGIVENRKLINSMRHQVTALTMQVKSRRDIASLLGISKTHVARIQAREIMESANG